MIKLINLIKIATGITQMDWSSESILNGPNNRVLSFRMAFDSDLHCEFIRVILSKRVGNAVVAEHEGRLFKVPSDVMAKILEDDFIAWNYTKMDDGGIIWQRRPVDGFVIPKINYSSREWEPDSTLIGKINEIRLKIDNWVLAIGRDRFR